MRKGMGDGALAALSALVLAVSGAHALRLGDAGMMAAWGAMAALVFLRLRWARWVVAAALALGVEQWIGVGTALVSVRRAMGEPWTRLAVILGAVAVANLAALVWTLTAGGGWYSRAGGAGPDHGGRDHQEDRDDPDARAQIESVPPHSVMAAQTQAAAFLITAAILWMARAKVAFPILLADRYFPGWGVLEIVALGGYAAWISGMMLDPARSAKVRVRIWSLFSVAFFGQLLLGLAGMERMLMTGSLHLPVPALIVAGPLFRGHGVFMLILFSATLLLVGPAWCSHLCYIGAWDDALCRVGGKRSKPLPRRAHWLRGVTLLLTAGVAFGLRRAGVGAGTAVLLAAVFGLGGVAVMVLVSRRAGLMIHCTTYCPMGLLSNLLGKINPWRIRVAEGCTHCGVCSRVCRYGALSNAALDRSRPGLTCTLCGDCIGRCKESHLHYAFPGLSPVAARAVFIALAVGLHAAFLGVARI